MDLIRNARPKGRRSLESVPADGTTRPVHPEGPRHVPEGRLRINSICVRADYEVGYADDEGHASRDLIQWQRSVAQFCERLHIRPHSCAADEKFSH